jgi:ferricrocin synthase
MERPSPQQPRPATEPKRLQELPSGPRNLAILNAEPTKLPGPQLLHELVKSTSAAGLPAILSRSSTSWQNVMSYEQMHAAADALAARISKELAGDDSDSSRIIPVLAPQSVDLYVSLLAVLKAGGAFCPLSLEAPPERVRFILQDVSAKVVLASRDQADKIPKDVVQTIITIDEPGSDVELGELRSENCPPISPDQMAYVMYTSGSTGTPKGVGISHSAATQSLLAHDRHIPAFQRFLQFAAPTFDVSVFEIFFPLVRGCTLVTCDRNELLNDLPSVLREMNVDACGVALQT